MSEINKYNNGKIYTVRCLINPELIYVGSCTQPLTKRFSGHKSDCKKGASISLYKHIIDNDWSDWYIELHEYYPCNNREELNRREGEVIREIGTINKNVAGRNNKEWREDNPEHNKLWRDNNHDHYLALLKKWRENNPNYNKEYYARKRSATPLNI